MYVWFVQVDQENPLSERVTWRGAFLFGQLAFATIASAKKRKRSYDGMFGCLRLSV